jgi:hypothetical protein
MKNTQKGFTSLIFVLVIVVLVGLGYFAYRANVKTGWPFGSVASTEHRVNTETTADKLKDTTAKNTSSDCIQNQEAIPAISLVSSTSLSVGDTIKIHGCNLAGFEGDNTIWIENAKGVKGILYALRRNDNENMEVVLKSPVCKVDNSYQTSACDDKNLWFNLTPGEYKIYTSPWGKKSNEIKLHIQSKL